MGNSAPPAKTRIVLADDHALARAGFRMLLEQQPGTEVIAEARDGAELVSLAIALDPDIVFTDIEMPGMGGLEAIRAIADAAPRVRCVVLSMHEDAAMVKLASASGAAGYLMKSASAQEFAQAVQAVTARGSYWSPAVAALLLTTSEPAPEELLTERQIEIVKRMASGQSAKEIAYELDLSSKTVDAHRARIMERLQLHDVASITRYAIKHRLVKL